MKIIISTVKQLDFSLDYGSSCLMSKNMVKVTQNNTYYNNHQKNSYVHNFRAIFPKCHHMKEELERHCAISLSLYSVRTGIYLIISLSVAAWQREHQQQDGSRWVQVKYIEVKLACIHSCVAQVVGHRTQDQDVVDLNPFFFLFFFLQGP